MKCKCGCDQTIEKKSHHKYRKPEYINGHYSKKFRYSITEQMHNKMKEMLKTKQWHTLYQDMKGEKNPNFKNWSSLEGYDKKFTKKFKEKIKERDNFNCQYCDAEITLYIHHIDYNKKNTSFKNCISLCNSCHSETNYNRKEWIKFFQDLLNYKYNYKVGNPMIIGTVIENPTMDKIKEMLK